MFMVVTRPPATNGETMIGTTLGHYQITSALGAGGMGEVYRARDTKLNRDVAIKVLPELFASDAERLARFTREAQTLAALNHPNIAHIHGLEESGGLRALVMELVEGDDLSVRIARGPMPVADAVPIARQIADALEAAHEQGIVHRDLKPANVKVRADGTVKVLDFGLAKAMDPGAASGARDVAHSPTFTARATQMGMIIGTAAYMAPEQARGKAVDRRADIWAFGVVLYEMLTGRRAFEGDDISEVLASVLKTEPDWSAVPTDAPPAVRRLLRRCLEKDPRRRLSAIADARLELDEIEPAGPVVTARVAPRRSIAATAWPVAAGVVVTAAVAALLWPSSHQTAGTGVTRLSVVAPAGAEVYPDSAEVAISPDGRMVAFVVGNPQQIESQLWIRPLDAVAARRVEGGDGAHLPFWSPDSRSVGFGAGGKLKRLPVGGGRAAVVCDANNFRGAAWSRDDVIVFAPDAGGPLYRVSANGGEPAPVTTLDLGRKESGHRFPFFLPDGERFLFAALPGRGGTFDIVTGSLRDGTRSLVASMESSPVYVEPGWLLFARRGVLAAQRFDARTQKVTGEAVSLEDEPGAVLDAISSWTAGHAASVSSSGALAYFSAPSAGTKALWLDAAGKPSGTLTLPAGRYTELRISPDGTHAMFVRSSSRVESSLWLVDLQRDGAAPFSTGRGLNESPVWSPDGTRVVFSSDRDGAHDLFMKDVADAAPEQPFYRSGMPFKNPAWWSADGKWVVLGQLDQDTLQNIYLLPTSGERTPTLYVRGPARDMGGWVSPDGKWMAYLSEDSGTLELYAQAFPVPGHKTRISTAGSLSAWWTRDGRHIVYLAAKQTTLMIADVEPGDTLRVGTPRVSATLPSGMVWLDAMPDRQRWLALFPENAGAGTVTVVQNWMAALDKKR